MLYIFWQKIVIAFIGMCELMKVTPVNGRFWQNLEFFPFMKMWLYIYSDLRGVFFSCELSALGLRKTSFQLINLLDICMFFSMIYFSTILVRNFQSHSSFVNWQSSFICWKILIAKKLKIFVINSSGDVGTLKWFLNQYKEFLTFF